MTELEEAILSIVTGQIKKIYTTMPGHVVEYGEGQQAKVQVDIEIDGVKLDPIPCCPVQHVGGNDWMVITQIDPGTEGMISMCMRDISVWLHGSIKQSGRKFSPSDSYFVPGIRSESGAVPNVENNGIQLRDKSGENFLWLKNDGDLYTSGNIHCAKKVIAEDDMVSKGEVLTRISHTHKFTNADGVPSVTEKATQS